MYYIYEYAANTYTYSIYVNLKYTHTRTHKHCKYTQFICIHVTHKTHIRVHESASAAMKYLQPRGIRAPMCIRIQCAFAGIYNATVPRFRARVIY